MAQFEVRLATRAKTKGRLGFSGASGSGKTISSLFFAYGMVGDWGKIGLIDTEGGRGELYPGDHVAGVDIGYYKYIRFDPPFEPARYVQALKTMEQEGCEVIILDSLSHAWEGTGGMLEQKDNIAATTRDNDYTAWRHITPQHNDLIDKIHRSPAHVICNCRAKAEYVIGANNAPKKIGMKPIFREGLEYELTLFFDLSEEHVSKASKDNSHIFDQRPVKITPEHGQQFMAWLNKGIDRPIPAPAPAAGSNGGNGNGNGKQERTPAQDDAWGEINALARMLNPDGTPHFNKNSWQKWWMEAYDVDSPAKLPPEEWPRARDMLLDEQALLQQPKGVDPLEDISDPFAEYGNSPAETQIERIGELVAACGLSKEDGNWTGDMFRVLAHLGLKKKKLIEYSIEERQLVIDNLAAAAVDPGAREALLASRSGAKAEPEPEPVAVDGPGF